MRPRLRLFNDVPLEGEQNVVQPDITVPLAQFVAILRDAVEKDLAWIKDFGDEEVRVSKDLYELLAAYRRMQDAA